jgi:hypothetical protein
MRDYTDDILSFVDRFLVSVGEVDGFVLKSKSPSCVVKDAKLYQENLIGLINAKGNGLFAQKVIERFPYLPVESEGRLMQVMLEKFMNNLLHIEVLLEYIRDFIYRFDDEYLASQFYLSPWNSCVKKAFLKLLIAVFFVV